MCSCLFLLFSGLHGIGIYFYLYDCLFGYDDRYLVLNDNDAVEAIVFRAYRKVNPGLLLLYHFTAYVLDYGCYV